MTDPRPMNDAEARAALTMFRLTVQYTRKTLSGWDWPGKQARQELILFLDEVEGQLQKMLAEPEGDGEQLQLAIEIISSRIKFLDKALAAAGIR
jgi:hypothetical protein